MQLIFSGNQKRGAQSGAQSANYFGESRCAKVRNREINLMIQIRAGPGEKQ